MRQADRQEILIKVIGRDVMFSWKSNWILIGALVLLLGGGASAAEKLVLTTPASPPLGPSSGPSFLKMTATEIFKRLGIEIEVISLPAERSIRNTNAGIEDGDLFRIAGLEKTYSNLIMVPEKMGDFEFMGYSLKAGVKVKNWAGLEPYKVGIITGWKMYELNVKRAEAIWFANERDNA